MQHQQVIGDLLVVMLECPLSAKSNRSIAISDCRYHVGYSKFGKNEWLVLPILVQLFNQEYQTVH
jgi:hypothetical protein